MVFEPVEDENNSLVKVSEPFTELRPSSLNFGNENDAQPLAKNLIVDEAVFGSVESEVVGGVSSFLKDGGADREGLCDDGGGQSCPVEADARDERAAS